MSNTNKLIIKEEFIGVVTYDYESPNEILNVNDKIEHLITNRTVELGGGSRGRSLVSKIKFNYIESTNFLRNILNCGNENSPIFDDVEMNYLRIIDDFKNSAIEYLDEYEKIVDDMFKNGDFSKMPDKIDYNIYFELHFNGKIFKDEISLKGYPQHVE